MAKALTPDEIQNFEARPLVRWMKRGRIQLWIGSVVVAVFWLTFLLPVLAITSPVWGPLWLLEHLQKSTLRFSLRTLVMVVLLAGLILGFAGRWALFFYYRPRPGKN